MNRNKLNMAENDGQDIYISLGDKLRDADYLQ